MSAKPHAPLRAGGRTWFDMRRQWWVVVLCVAMALCWSLLYTLQATPQFRASTQLLFSPRPVALPAAGDEDEDVAALEELSQGLAFSRQQVETYGQLATSTQVLASVMKEDASPLTEEALRARVTAVAATDTATLTVTVQDPDAERAARLANAVGRGLAEAVDRLEAEAAGGPSPVRVTTLRAASPPSMPFWPRADFNLAVALVAGLVVGVGLATMRDQLDTRVRGEQQLAEVTLAPPLVSVPWSPRTKQGDGPEPVSEDAVARLRVNLGLGTSTSGPRSLLFTSARPREGKTTMALALAQSCARSGLRVLVVDCDLRSAGASARGGAAGAPGLSELLIGLVAVERVLYRGTDGVDLLPAGQRPPNPAELLGSRYLGGLIETWRQQYDIVLVDGSPLVGIADGLAVVPHMDSVLCVVRDSQTRRPHLAEALALLGAVRGNLAGVVLNGVRQPKPGGSRLTWALGRPEVRA